MALYFAYGSNMSQSRLEKRVGNVTCYGVAELAEHVHAFSKRGQDGTGKGNIEDLFESSVYGVVYELSEQQLEALLPFESGYEQKSVTLAMKHRESVTALTFKTKDCVQGLSPTPEYAQHYLAGLKSHEFPAGYRLLILKQIKQALGATRS